MYQNQTGEDQRGLSNNFWETIRPIKPVTKKTGYILVPALGYFSGFVSYGVPLIAAQFTYQSSNNLTISCIPQPWEVGAANLNLAVRYNDPKTATPIRFKFWNFDTNPAQDIPNAPVYAGQPIYGANFVIEVWSQGGNPQIALPNTICLAVSPRKLKYNLEECDTFELASAVQCQSLTSTNGLNLPLNFLNCACAIPSGTQQGSNYRFDLVTGMLEFLNATTGMYNPINTLGAAGHEVIQIQAQD